MQLLVLALASTLGSPWSMATAGRLIGLVLGDLSLHYPGSFYVLPSFFSLVDTFLYWIPGSFLIPLMLIRLFAPREGEAGGGSSAAVGQGAAAGALRAYPATFVAMALNVALLFGWQWAVRQGPYYWIHSLAPGNGGDVVTWIVAAVGGYAIGALFLYVPIHAIAPRAALARSLIGGVLEGARLIAFTVVVIFLFIWPALPFLAVVQLRPAILISKFRPELVPFLLAIYAVLSSLATYLIYAAAARLHWTARAETR